MELIRKLRLAFRLFLKEVSEGRYLSSVDDAGLLLGRKMMERLETNVGKRVVLMSRDVESQAADRGFSCCGSI